MGIIPNVMGVAVYSPRLDDLGNSSKGIEFFKILTKLYPFHTYDNLCNKNNLLLKKDILNNNINIYNLLTAASIGDLNTIIILYSQGLDLNSYDYDKRTALHLACSEGHLHIVKYLIKKNVDKTCSDRWNNKPIDDINRYKESIDIDNTPIYKSNMLKCEEIVNLLNN